MEDDETVEGRVVVATPATPIRAAFRNCLSPEQAGSGLAGVGMGTFSVALPPVYLRPPARNRGDVWGLS